MDEGPLRAGSVIGSVFDERSQPLAGARVQILGGATKRVFHDLRVDSRGRFQLPKLKPGKYRLGISADGHNLHLWDLEVVPRGVARTLRVQLSLGS